MLKSNKAVAANPALAAVNYNAFYPMQATKKEGLAAYISRHKRFGIIIIAIVALNAIYGFDARFTIINLLWILISVVKIR